MSAPRIAIVTGANRGIGFEICRQLAREGVSVVLTARSEANGERACRALASEGLEVRFHQLDITDGGSVKRIGIFARQQLKRVDILVNNAGIYPEQHANVLSSDLAQVRHILDTNLFGAWRLCQELVPLMQKGGYGRIVNLSSGAGQLDDMDAEHPGYRVSKTALNALTRTLQAELDGHNILTNAVCPGWVRTDMGGKEATRSVEEGAKTPVWLALLPDNGPRGGFFRDKHPIPW